MRDAQGRVRPRVRSCGGRNGEWQGGKERASFPQKMGRKKRKEGKFRKKVHKFSFILSLPSKKETFFSQKFRLFEIKILLLRLIKHNFPFIPPHCGVHIAQSRGTFPDPPAQTLFDLLNPSRLRLIPSYRNRPQRRCPSPSGDICTTANRPLGLVRKEGGANAYFLPQERGTRLLWTTRFGQPHSFLVLLPVRRIRTSLFDFRGLAF